MFLQTLGVLLHVGFSLRSSFIRGRPSDRNGFIVDDMSAEIAGVLEEVSSPLGVDLLTRTEDLDIFEGDLTRGRIVRALSVLLKNSVQPSELLVVAVFFLLNVVDLGRFGSSVEVSLHDAIGLLSLAEEGHLTTEAVASLGGVALRVGVGLRRPGKNFSVEGPRVAHPRVHRLNQVEVVSGVRADPG